MAEKRQLELLLLRLVPHALRDDFITVGVVVLEPGGEFADARFTRDWKRVECFAPEIELEHLERLEAVVRGSLKEIRGRADLLMLLEERFGPEFDIGPVKAIEARDPVAEMQVLTRDYLAPMQPAERVRRMGRLGIVSRMQDAFADAGVLGLMQRDIEMKEFTGENDPFRVDFGFRVGKSLKMFQALALSLSRDPAVTLAYRYARIQEGMRKRQEEALLTAVISEDATRKREEVASGMAMLKANEIEVRDVSEMAEIAEEVRRELRA
jgi:Protein of unknown function (DUF3037)